MTDDANTILFVEDDLDIRETLTEILREEGWQVDAAGHGLAALEALRSDKPLPAVILLDLMMPIMNGWQFRAEQLADAKLEHLPVVIISAASNIEQTAAAMGAKGFVRKPVKLDELLNALRSAAA
jgi:CheY-like chemotaxis protein